MKLFSGLASCWIGVAVTPAAPEPAGGRQQAEEQRVHARRTSKRTAKVSGAAVSWKPKLNAISENSPISDAAAEVIGKKRQVKAKPKPPSSLAEDQWKYSQAMAPPAFAPTSFLF